MFEDQVGSKLNLFWRGKQISMMKKARVGLLRSHIGGQEDLRLFAGKSEAWGPVGLAPGASIKKLFEGPGTRVYITRLANRDRIGAAPFPHHVQLRLMQEVEEDKKESVLVVQALSASFFGPGAFRGCLCGSGKCPDGMQQSALHGPPTPLSTASQECAAGVASQPHTHNASLCLIASYLTISA